MDDVLGSFVPVNNQIKKQFWKPLKIWRLKRTSQDDKIAAKNAKFTIEDRDIDSSKGNKSYRSHWQRLRRNAEQDKIPTKKKEKLGTLTESRGGKFVRSKMCELSLGKSESRDFNTKTPRQDMHFLFDQVIIVELYWPYVSTIP